MTITVSESIVVALVGTLAPNKSESISVNELVTLRFSRLLVNVSDAITVSESVAVSRSGTNNSLLIVASDNVTIGGRILSAFDSVSVSEFVRAFLPRLVPSVAEFVSVNDNSVVSIQSSTTPFLAAWAVQNNQLI